MENENQLTETSSEEAADFAALQAMANDAPLPPGAPEPEPEPMRAPLDAEISGLLQAVAAIVKPILPSVAEIYSQETCQTIGGALAPVCVKHGWLQDGVGGKWGEELLALAVVGPVAWATVEAAKADLAAKKPRQVEDNTIPGTAHLFDASLTAPQKSPGQKTVSFGAPVPAEAAA